jgi:hypothetical protein
MEAERILGSFVLKKHGALKTVNLPNGGRLNHDFEQMGMAYAPSPLLGTEASQAVREKRKAEESKKTDCKKVKDSSEPCNCIQDGTPKENRCCVDDLAEGQPLVTRYI